MSTDPEVSKVKDWLQPRTKKELSSFLGLCSYFRKYVKGFAVTASPLFDLTRKDVPFQWSAGADEAFIQLKKKLSAGPQWCLSPGSVKELGGLCSTVTPVAKA